MNQNQKIIGLTGGIGSGKTTVAKIFTHLGIPVYNSDERAKSIMVEDEQLKANITSLFGEKAYQNGTLNRAYLGQVAFREPEILQKLNALVHPAVQLDFEKWCHLHQDMKILMKEAAILFEAGSYKHCDSVILVRAPLEVRIKRVQERSGLSREEILSRVAKQWPDEKKIPLSQYIIENDGHIMLIPQVLSIYNQLK